MELAALASFAVLVVAWIVAPDRPARTTVHAAMPESPPEAPSEAQPLAA